MPKTAKPLSAAHVNNITQPGLHAVGGCTGLMLQITPSGARSWTLRVTIAGRRRDIGLGPTRDVSLKRAREIARDMREAIRAGRDPVAERDEQRRALAAARAARITFDEAAKQYLAAKRHEFKNAKHAKQWETTLDRYASPVIGRMHVEEVTLNDVVRVLEPIWYSRTETASRLRGRIERVLAWATASGYRTGDNPAAWRGNLDAVLPKPSKVSNVQHHRALPVDKVGAFMRDLRERDGMAARALEFLTLTATRSNEVRGATWGEIDLHNRVWVVPGDRMKSGREHRVPLSDDAVALLERVPRMQSTNYVFPSSKGGKLSDMSLSAVMRRMGADATPHGLRSTFRDWCSEHTAYPHEVIEMSLAHVIPDKVERAYRRGDLFNKRARLMRDWAVWCDTVQPERDADNVEPIRGRGEATA